MFGGWLLDCLRNSDTTCGLQHRLVVHWLLPGCGLLPASSAGRQSRQAALHPPSPPRFASPDAIQADPFCKSPLPLCDIPSFALAFALAPRPTATTKRPPPPLSCNQHTSITPADFHRSLGAQLPHLHISRSSSDVLYDQFDADKDGLLEGLELLKLRQSSRCAARARVPRTKAEAKAAEVKAAAAAERREG